MDTTQVPISDLARSPRGKSIESHCCINFYISVSCAQQRFMTLQLCEVIECVHASGVYYKQTRSSINQLTVQSINYISFPFLGNAKIAAIRRRDSGAKCGLPNRTVSNILLFNADNDNNGNVTKPECTQRVGLSRRFMP